MRGMTFSLVMTYCFVEMVNYRGQSGNCQLFGGMLQITIIYVGYVVHIPWLF